MRGRGKVVGLLVSLMASFALAGPGDVAPIGAPDGQINSGDALVTFRMIRGLAPRNYDADVAPIGTPDGAIDLEDVKTLQRAGLGLETIPSLTLEQANSAGLMALSHENYAGAKHLFDVAVSNILAGSPQLEKDIAYFSRGVSRVFIFLGDLSSDMDPNNGLQRMSDVVEAFGCIAGPTASLASAWERQYCPPNMPSNSPTGADLQAFLSGPFRNELQGALSDLSMVSTGFDVNLTAYNGGPDVDMDYGDVLAFRGFFEALLSQIDFLSAYDLDFDIDDADNNPVTHEAFMAAHPRFLALVNSSKLVSAGSLLDAAFQDLDLAVQHIQAESDDQTNDLVSLIGTLPAEITEFRNTLSRGRQSLAGTAVDASLDTAAGVKSFRLKLSKLYSGFDLRSLWPLYSGDTPGYFRDPTLNGVISGTDINEDVFRDGIPDVLQ